VRLSSGAVASPIPSVTTPSVMASTGAARRNPDIFPGPGRGLGERPFRGSGM